MKVQFPDVERFFHMDVRESQYLWTSGCLFNEWLKRRKNLETCKAMKPNSTFRAAAFEHLHVWKLIDQECLRLIL